ncbi:transposase [Streptomyces olivaceus]|uniref:Tn3 family transposase n=1 Tax=Streptomyces olivaceus TaxID=47716 RepID=UPI0027E04024|nr:Tn3 family transposase [Streptomyces olivaceus]MBZ6205797.1 transposase [Streptomyces olivaceus]
MRARGGGLVASADGVRFTMPVQTLYAGSNPCYFGLRHKGATWLNVVNDQVMGLGGVVVPGMLRDSLFILDAIHARDGGPTPETVITDTLRFTAVHRQLLVRCPPLDSTAAIPAQRKASREYARTGSAPSRATPRNEPSGFQDQQLAGSGLVPATPRDHL